MRADSTFASGVLMTAILAVICTPLFVSAADSPVQVESRESSGVTYRQPIEAEPEGSGFEQQYQMQILQQEVMQLRGVVEQLQHELKTLRILHEGIHVSQKERKH